MSQFSDIDIETTENVDINLSPLIDMMFLLLIFFMVTSVFIRESGVDINKPEASHAQQLPTERIVFALTEDGQITYNGEQITINDVRAAVTRALDNKRRPVIIKADHDARTGRLMELIDEAKAGGGENISVATEHPASDRMNEK